jgi:hypothetical protein
VVPAEWAAPALDIGFNAKLLLETLAAMGGTDIEVRFADPAMRPRCSSTPTTRPPSGWSCRCEFEEVTCNFDDNVRQLATAAAQRDWATIDAVLEDRRVRGSTVSPRDLPTRGGQLDKLASAAARRAQPGHHPCPMSSAAEIVNEGTGRSLYRHRGPPDLGQARRHLSPPRCRARAPRGAAHGGAGDLFDRPSDLSLLGTAIKGEVSDYAGHPVRVGGRSVVYSIHGVGVIVPVAAP